MNFTPEEFRKIGEFCSQRKPVKIVCINKFGEPAMLQGVVVSYAQDAVSVSLPINGLFLKEDPAKAKCVASATTDIPKKNIALNFGDPFAFSVIKSEDFADLAKVNRLFILAVLDDKNNVIFENKDAGILENITKLNGNMQMLKNRLDRRETIEDDPVTKALRSRIGKQTLIYLGVGVGTKRYVINSIGGLDDEGNVLVQVQNGKETKNVPIKKDTMIFEERNGAYEVIANNNNSDNKAARKKLDSIYAERMKALSQAERVVGYHPDHEARKAYEGMAETQKKLYDDYYRAEQARAKQKVSEISKRIFGLRKFAPKQNAQEVQTAPASEIVADVQREQEQAKQLALKKEEEQLANAKAKQLC